MDFVSGDFLDSPGREEQMSDADGIRDYAVACLQAVLLVPPGVYRCHRRCSGGLSGGMMNPHHDQKE
ncbi:hypothetical protein HKX68_03230 [Dickeya dadantii]|uniref:hypothetical protein n=1 Tax=Dickeya dadantii TaxID=204038 RepID=UPI0013724C2C|nr:hypothetical protein [Dickeya dadantii]NAT77237.1 hypothetical protein [Dickeya dadantii]NPE62089.1 hypothetical protein [Dickeya dadantii]